MDYNTFFATSRKPDIAVPAPEAQSTPVSPGLDVEKALYVAGLLANLLNRVAATNGFRGAIGAHPHMTEHKASFGSDEGARADFGITAIATASRASITVAGTDAGRLGFMGFAPVHKQANGCEPDWGFEDPDAFMRARCSIIDITFDVALSDNPDGSATMTLELVR